MKICLTASLGGHLEQILTLEDDLKENNELFLLTERSTITKKAKNGETYELCQINRKEKLFPIYLIINSFRSIRIFLKENPDVTISTGALATIPMCLLTKFFGKKLVYIESFAKINSPTLTGKFLYKFADRFYVQWDEMTKVYPRAVNIGGLY